MTTTVSISMIITKKISRRMVEAKRRLRMERNRDWNEPAVKTSVPRKTAAKWTIEIRDGERGDRVRLSLHRSPWPNSWIVGPDIVSSAEVASRIRVLLTHAH